MLPPVVDLADAFEARFASAAAEVRAADSASPDADMVASVLSDQTRQFLELADWTERSIAALIQRENVFPSESRHAVARIVILLRSWAPRFADLHLPEAHPNALPIPHLVRPFNDALRTLTRALLDGARLLALRRDEDERAFTAKVAATADEVIAEHADILADLAK